MMRPGSEAELASLIKDAKGPLAIRGGGTRGVEAAGEVLSLEGLSGVELYEPGALTLVVKAGTPVAEVETLLAGENQRLAFEPMDHRGLLGTTGTPTMGGLIAGNISGPRRIQAGAARDFTLGVRMVDGSGTILKNGGRVMKNVTGYDLVKLMAGSWGTLAVLSEVALKVLPMPETQATLVLHGLDHSQAVAAMAAALGSPYDVTGAAHLPQTGADKDARTVIRVEGFEASVAYRIEQLKAHLAGFGAEMDVADDPETLWKDIRDVAPFQGRDGDIWRISAKPSDGPSLVQKAGSADAMFDWAGGLIWLRCAQGTDMRARLGAFDGHAQLVRGTGQPRFHPETAGVAALTSALRLRFDPRAILNSGLMAPPAMAAQ